MLKQITLSIILLFSVHLLYSQSENKYYEVTKDNINLRAEPNPESTVLAKLSKSQLVELIQVSDGWANITYKPSLGNTLRGYVKSKYIAQTGINIIADKKLVTPEKQVDPVLKYSILSLLLISFICYIIAMIKVRNNSMVAIANWYDFWLLVFPFIALIFAAFMSGDENKFVPILLLVLGGLSFCGSIVYSFVANRGNTFNIIVSIFAKVFVMLIIVLSVLYIFRGRNKENTFYQDVKHDLNTMAAIGVAGFLIFSLVGHGRHEELVEDLKYRV